MALVTWEDRLSTGIKAMDEQHKGLFNTLNELHDSMLKGTDKAATGRILDRLVQYTHTHFAAEEALLSRANYPDLAGQKTKHTDLLRQVEQFVGRYRRGEIAIDVDLLLFLRDWLVTHIQKEDRNYGPSLTQHGMR
ncbi:MAG TPA: bacteriohemerythrin [Terracidiphilus sp.]|jgi:hemerythrin